jgi:uncharacterized protein YndB with AHSA1/START domain
MIRRQVVVPVSPERLWEALTDPDQVAGWFGGRVEWDLQEGGKAVFRGDDGTARLGRVEAVRPGRHLRFRWWPAASPESEPPARGATGSEGGSESEVTYLLEPLDEGTRLTIQERPVPQPTGRGPQACATGATRSAAAEAGPSWTSWTPWDRRLVGAWAGLVGAPVRS